jgi:signal transduction histidine kinase
MNFMPEVCRVAPSPAMAVHGVDAQTAFELNPAAQDWELVRHWSAAQWLTLARAIAQCARQGRDDAGHAELGVAWRSTAHGEARLAWLSPLGNLLMRRHTDLATPPDASRLAQASSLQISLAAGLMGLALWRIDLATQRIHGNELGYHLVGLEPAFDGLPLQDLRQRIHPDDLALIERAAAEAAAGMTVVEAEARYRLPDGSYRTLLTRRMAERDDSGKAVALVGVSMDISARVEAHRIASEAAQRMKLIAEATGVGIWRSDLASGLVSLNMQMFRLFDMAPCNMSLRGAGKTLMRRTHPQDRKAVRELVRSCLTGAATAGELAFRLRQGDGNLRWVVARVQRTASGSGSEAFGVLLDLTDQRNLQDRLRRAERRTTMATRALGLGIWEYHVATAECWWDSQMYRLRGLPEGPPSVSHSVRHLGVHADHVPDVERHLAALLETGEERQLEFRVVWGDGSVHWLASRASLVRDEQGRPQRVLGIDWDITAHKRNDDLHLEKAAAEQANEAKGLFLARMSQDLRTPLNAVLGFAQLLANDSLRPLDEKQHDRVQHILVAGEHLLGLINDTLDLASIEAGTLSVAGEAVDLATVVQQAIGWVDAAAAKAQVTVDCGDITGMVQGDRRRVRQVLVNLLSNAIRFNRPGGRVELRHRAGLRNGMLGIEVRDNGRGMTSVQVSSLFEPFERLGTQAVDGTGIGLSVVRHLVQRMGGRIDVDSTLHAGTRFIVWLPGASEDAIAATRVPAVPTLSHIEVLRPQPVDVEHDLLYIEDDPVNLLLVQELLALRPGLHLHTAVDGRSGVAAARSLHPSLIFIDLHLPDLDGYEVLRRIRADPALRGIPMVAVSANVLPEQVAKTRQAGFHDFWSKPINPVQFLSRLDAWVLRLPKQAA